MTPEPDDPGLAVEEPPAGLGGRTGTAVEGPPPAGPATNGATAGEPPRSTRWLREAVIVVLVAVVVAVLLRTFVVQTFYIPSGSMEPTLQVGDRILVNKLSYHLHGVGRGDIVVFSRPPNENCGGPEVNDLVKRVIGLPGEVISVSGGHVDVDGRRLDESWLPSAEQGVTKPGPGGTAYSLEQSYRVPANDYFVMGDNRTDSCDSRFWGPISKSLIVGKVEMRVWPVSSLGFF
ncbi:MAG TPA: signal peptidase I [Acidimicrobiales bacterium]|nr:signal peptidase I [Acidimicrobiales bacterium]